MGPKAPWLDNSAEFTEWVPLQKEQCCVCDKEGVEVDDCYVCIDCFEPEEIDFEALKAEREYDAWKDSRFK